MVWYASEPQKARDERLMGGHDAVAWLEWPISRWTVRLDAIRLEKGGRGAVNRLGIDDVRGRMIDSRRCSRATLG